MQIQFLNKSLKQHCITSNSITVYTNRGILAIGHAHNRLPWLRLKMTLPAFNTSSAKSVQPKYLESKMEMVRET